MKAILRAVPTLMLIVVGSTSFLLSYVAIRDVSIALGAVPANLAWAVPVCIDGGILAGSAAIWSSSYQRKRRDPLAFITVAVLLATSVIINTQHAGTETLGKWIAALPPLILLACLEIVAAGHRRSMEDADSSAPSPVIDQAEPTSLEAAGTHAVAAPLPQTDVEPATLMAPVAAKVTPVLGETDVDAPQLPAAVAVAPPAPAAAPAMTAVEAGVAPTVPDTQHIIDVTVDRAQSSASSTQPQSRPRDLTQELEAFLATEATKPAVRVEASSPAQTPEGVGSEDLGANDVATANPEPSPAVAQLAETDATEQPEHGDAPVTAAQAAAEAALDGADKVRAMFEAHLAAGGDATDRTVASTIADQTGMSVQYVRRVIKPLRAAQLVS